MTLVGLPCSLAGVGYNPKDHYFKKAKELNYAARSVFKLEEMDAKYRLFRPGQVVLDLGCAPGSWSQYSSQKVGDKGRVLGIDLTEVRMSLANAVFLQADLRDLNLENVFKEHGFTPPFSLVLSDMAPKTTGIRITDQARSAELCELAMHTADRFLATGGNFACKMFHSDEFVSFRDELRKRYNKVEAIKPAATRQISKEIFLLGLGKKN